MKLVDHLVTHREHRPSCGTMLKPLVPRTGHGLAKLDIRAEVREEEKLVELRRTNDEPFRGSTLGEVQHQVAELLPLEREVLPSCGWLHGAALLTLVRSSQVTDSPASRQHPAGKRRVGTGPDGG